MTLPTIAIIVVGILFFATLFYSIEKLSEEQRILPRSHEMNTGKEVIEEGQVSDDNDNPLSSHRVKHVFISNLILTFGGTKPTVKPVTVTIIFIVPRVGLALPNVTTHIKELGEVDG